MAFQAPGRPLRHLSLPGQGGRVSSAFTGSLDQPFTPDTEEWVVFSPSVAETPTISNRHPVSDVASAITTASPAFARHDTIPGAFADGVEGEREQEEDEDDETSFDCAETDSLQPFRDMNLGPMLPSHDGLGTFAPAHGHDSMPSFRSLEESLRIVALSGTDSDKTARINRWRMEQSQAFIEEIERATRQRRMSLTSRRSVSGDKVAQMNTDESEVEIVDTQQQDMTEEGETDADSGPPTPKPVLDEPVHNESFWKRITRSFIRDIMGLDDHLLEVIFGEALPAEAYEPAPSDATYRHGIEGRLLEKIAKELGELVKLYSLQNLPGCAYSSLQQHPDNTDDKDDESTSGDGAKTPQARSPLPPLTTSFVSVNSGTSSVPNFRFEPTLAKQAPEDLEHAAQWGIEEEDEDHQVTPPPPGEFEQQLRKEYWEQDLDMQLVFSYLKSRFSRRSPPKPNTPSTPVTPAATPMHAPTHTHHPLISQPPPHHPPTSLVRTSGATVSKVSPTTASGFFGAGGMVLAGLGAGTLASSSCASRSVRGCGNGKGKVNEKSAGQAQGRSGGYYWDVATSVGSGKTGSCVGTGVWAAI